MIRQLIIKNTSRNVQFKAISNTRNALIISSSTNKRNVVVVPTFNAILKRPFSTTFPFRKSSNENGGGVDVNKTQKENIPKRVQDLIKSSLDKHSVVLFMKGTPGWPQCGFSRLVVQILELYGVEKYHAVDVLADDELRQGIKVYSDWPTIPQLYVNGEFIGGADILRNLHETGQLEDVFSVVKPKAGN